MLKQLPPENLTFGVVGPPGAVAAYQQMASLFAPLDRRVTVKVVSWPDEATMMADLRNGARVPDVFLASHRDLFWLTQHQTVQPIDQLLDDRGVDFGDVYPRSSLTAFGMNSRLQCLPYGIEPSVIFYNKRLVKFRQMKNNPPTAGQGWSIDQFAAAARWAVRHHPGVAGAYVDPSLEGLAPFVLSGGGQVFAGSNPPTSLALSSPASQKALVRTVRVLHEPDVMASPAELGSSSPEQAFVQGRLALLQGSRQLVPALRNKLGFSFDVMPMPTLDSPATVGDLTGLCISQHARDVGTAADFLVYAGSPDALGEVASAGYLQPANQTVALSDAFQQHGHLPQHAAVFTFSVKSMYYPPLIGQWDQLDQAVDPLVQSMVRRGTSRVPTLTRHIDRISRRWLGVPLGPTGSGQPSPG